MGFVLYSIITIISVLLAYRVAGLRAYGNTEKRGIRQEKIDRICMGAIFIILFGASALRIYTGNDYQTYINHFHDIVCGNFVVTERGFNLIVTAIYNFFTEEYYLVVFAVFAFLTVAVFLKALYDQSVDFPMTFFFFMTLGIYFQTYNTVRYYFALAIVLFSMRYILRKQYIRFLVTILIASLFHKTALIVLLFYPLAYVCWKRWQLFLVGIFALTGLVFQEQYMEIFIRLYPSYVNEEEYLASGSISIINILRSLAVLVFAIYVIGKNKDWKNRELRFYYHLNLGALALYLCFFFIPFASRIGYYLNISHLFFIPALIKAMPDEKLKTICRRLALLAGAVYFLAFLYKATAINVRILPYSSWLWTEIR